MRAGNFQSMKLGKQELKALLRKKIYRINNIQKEMMPLMAKYKKQLKKVFAIFDSIPFFN